MTKHTSIRVLIINPNTSTYMTDALRPVAQSLSHLNVQYTFFTSPDSPSNPGVPSINNGEDAARSAEVCLPHLIPLVPQHDAFLVACYSEHPLVRQLRTECDKVTAEATKGSGGAGARKYVTGIFEASITTSLSLVGSYESLSGFGIVSTGKAWEALMDTAVKDLLGGTTARFLGCETTGLNADQLHQMPPEDVRARMMKATKRLVENGQTREVELKAVCLGCAGMVGLEEAVRQALLESLGEQKGREVSIVDGVKAGISQLVMHAHDGF